MQSLETNLTNAGVNLAGWTLSRATAISANGKVITGTGQHGALTEAWIVRLP